MADLCEQIRDNHRFARAGHSEQDAVLGVFPSLAWRP